jgi:hypothetical protein
MVRVVVLCELVELVGDGWVALRGTLGTVVNYSALTQRILSSDLPLHHQNDTNPIPPTA